jgi:hypothetical protein
MTNLNDPHELEQEAEEITLPGGGEGGVDRPEPPGFIDPAVRGSETAAEPVPQDDADRDHRRAARERVAVRHRIACARPDGLTARTIKHSLRDARSCL